MNGFRCAAIAVVLAHTCVSAAADPCALGSTRWGGKGGRGAPRHIAAVTVSVVPSALIPENLRLVPRGFPTATRPAMLRW